MKNIFFLLATSILQVSLFAQKKWDGGGGDNLWSTASNWQPDGIPSTSDDIILNNELIPVSYSVQLPTGGVATMVNTLQITPSGNNSITLELPPSNTFDPGLQISGPGNALVLNNGAVLKNSSGASTGNGITVNSIFRINNGGRYIHNTTRGNANLINQLSTEMGTELGIFEFDVPGAAGYTLSLTGNNFGSIVFSATASGGAKSYSGGGASTLTIRGNLRVNSGASVTSSMTADIILNGNLEVNGNLNLNPTNSGTVNRSLIFSGNAKQIISGTGNISEGINFRNMEVGGGATVEMQRNLPMTNAGNKFLVKPNGNLETGTRVIGGNGSFELGPNGHLVIGSLSGITLTSGIGNIQTATRNFSNDGIYEYNGLGQQDSGDALPGNINTLFVNKVSGDLIITASTKVMGVLNLNQGRIVCSENNMVSITSATTVISPVNNYGNINEGWEQSFVNGPIRLESNSTAVVVVPVGKNDRFAPVKIEKANSTPVNYTIEYFPSAFVDVVNIANPPLDHVSELEYWNIQTNVNNGDDDAQLSLSWRPGSGVGATDEERADLCVAHFEDRGNGLRWEMEGVDPVASGNASYGFITSDNITATFSSFTLGSESNNNVLPWKLLSFSAIPAKDRIQINWEIADEMDILAYAIERSSDGQIFHPLGRMISEHKKALSSYGFSDVKPMNGWNYYRLTIVDQANRLDYSQIIKIYYEPFSFRIFPNPVCGTLEIFLSTPRSRYNLDIVNSSGQVVKRFFSMPGRTLRVDDLQKGTYFLRVYNENQTVTRSFVKL